MRLPALLAVLTLAAFGVAGCNATQKRFDEANNLRRQGRHKEALRAFQEVLAELGEGPVSESKAELRLRALKHAADVAYLELGQYLDAVSYYRRVISLNPQSDDAMRSRAAIGDIYRDRFNDRMAAIAQYADIAQSNFPEASRYQLKLAREYLELKNFQQSRTEARILRERWPTSDEADEGQLITAQAWTLEKRNAEAVNAFQALIDRKPKQDVLARALEGQAHLYAQLGKLDKALELYNQAAAIHPNPEAILTNIAAVKRRRQASMTVKPGDRDAVFDRKRPNTKDMAP